MSDCLRIANCSGFYGDRLSAAKEMVDGGPIDVLTGDYLAELTLMILLKDKLRDPELGYARTFLLQLQQVAARCSERGIRIVVNAGGLNPAGLARACQALYGKLDLDAEVAWIEGDDLLDRLEALQQDGEPLAHMETGRPLKDLDARIMSANAYLGARGIRLALEQGADLVICPRVTDASLTVGPAAWKFGWADDDWDRLAAAVVAGHIIECGPQCTGGNYSFFTEIADTTRPGFPIAEMYEDGSFVITKHEGTGGEVNVGTVTAQLLYEIAGPRYANPDVVARLDTIQLAQESPDRVRVTGIRGEPAPEHTKVCINYSGGFKNTATFVIPGLDIEEKAATCSQSFWAHAGGRENFEDTRETLDRGGDGADAFALLTLAARDPDEKKVGRGFFNAGIELALANYPGFRMINPSRSASEITVYWPALVVSERIAEKVFIRNDCIEIPPLAHAGTATEIPEPQAPPMHPRTGEARQAPIGALLGARSGDKGGNANVGFWARSEEAYVWMAETLTADLIRDLYPEASALEIERFEFPNLLAVNFVIHGLLGEGVSASLRPDAQAKMLGEELRAKRTDIPVSLLDTA